MRKALVLILLAACRGPEPAPAPGPTRWVHVERPATGGGDGRVAGSERSLALLRIPVRDPGPPSRRIVLDLPGRAGVGEEFEIGVRVPGAAPGERRVVRIRPRRAGLRLPDGDRVEVVGAGPVLLRAVADSGGPAEFAAEEIR